MGFGFLGRGLAGRDAGGAAMAPIASAASCASSSENENDAEGTSSGWWEGSLSRGDERVRAATRVAASSSAERFFRRLAFGF